MDRGAWWAKVHVVTQSQTGLKQVISTHWPKPIISLNPVSEGKDTTIQSVRDMNTGRNKNEDC